MTYSTNTFTASQPQQSQSSTPQTSYTNTSSTPVSTPSVSAAQPASGGNANTSSVVQISSYTNQGVQPGSGGEILRDGTTYYDTIRSDLEQLQRVDVTEQIRRYANEIYGGSDNTQQSGLAASKSLQFSKASTMQRAQRLSVRAIPFTFQFVGQVGLFGAENAYVEIDLDITNTLEDAYEEPDWDPADIIYGDFPTVDTYVQATIDFDEDLYVVNTYEPALITNLAPALLDNPKVSIQLDNIGTGNIYVDNWLETMIYKRDKEMWGYDKIYLSPKDRFYVGMHARNTRRLNYNVTVTIGEEYLPSSSVAEQRLIASNTYIY